MSQTLSEWKRLGHNVWVLCEGPGCGHGKILTDDPAIDQSLIMDELRALRMRCRRCGSSKVTFRAITRQKE